MNEHDKKVIAKICEHIAAVLKYCENCGSLEEFESNRICVEACVFNLMQIGELAKGSLSDEAKKSMTNIPWKQIYGMRNRIVHGYEGVEMSIVWDTISNDLPALKRELEKNII